MDCNCNREQLGSGGERTIYEKYGVCAMLLPCHAIAMPCLAVDRARTSSGTAVWSEGFIPEQTGR
jgi:hypothetical protein